MPSRPWSTPASEALLQCRLTSKNKADKALGEAVAIGILRDLRVTYHEDFQGFSLTKFDGASITT